MKKRASPRYRIEKLPFIPTEQGIDHLIAGCGEKNRNIPSIAEGNCNTTQRSIEPQLTDADFVNSTTRVTPEKHSNPRMFKISSKVSSMPSMLPKKTEKLFGSYELRGFVRPFQRQPN